MRENEVLELPNNVPEMEPRPMPQPSDIATSATKPHTVRIEDIKVGERHRKDLGNIGQLADSIKEVGLLHAIVIRPDNLLIAGARRLKACRKLGWDTVPVTVIDLEQVARGEYAENVYRKDFLPSEIDAIRRELEPVEKAAAEERKSEGQKAGAAGGKEGGRGRKKNPSAKVSHKGKQPQRAADKVGAYVGKSGRTVEKIATVMDAAEKNPAKFGPVAEEMDRSGKVDSAYQKVKAEEADKRLDEISDIVDSVASTASAVVSACVRKARESNTEIMLDLSTKEERVAFYSEMIRDMFRARTKELRD